MSNQSLSPPSTEDLVGSLAKPSAYPHLVTGSIEVIQTHISIVFLTGDRVYKLKKHLELGFLDYSTLERRRLCCEAEVQLNQRLAPKVYRGVVAITQDPSGALRVSGEGQPVAEGGEEEVVDYAVVMNRLPADRTFKALLAQGGLTRDHVEDLALLMARFHINAERGRRISSFGDFSVVAGNCRENFDQLVPFTGHTIHPSVLRRLRELTEAELETHRGLIEARVQAGLPCDCHGDLRLEHVYLLPQAEEPDELVAIDCIEFNERFRYSDPIADLAFPVMELSRAGRVDLAQALQDSYFSETEDEEGRALLALYVAYRATVRGKVASFKAAQPEVSSAERETAAERARGHFLFALATLAPPTEGPLLTLIGGLPGTGKSTVASGLEEAGFRWIRSDKIRKQLAGLSPDKSAVASYGGGIYSAEWSERTYAECLKQATKALLEGERVVVDAAFASRPNRDRFMSAARDLGVPARVLICEISPATARQRLLERSLDPASADPSDADWEIYEGMAKRWDPVGGGCEPFALRLDTSASREEAIASALELLEA